jgi:simple sugar transport system permease protein
MKKIQIIEKREQPRGRLFSLLLIGISLVIALLFGAILILLANKNPIEAYKSLFYGAFIRKSGIIETLVKGTPLLIAGLGMVIAFKANLWNSGGEGQIYFGALFATIAGIYFKGLPAYIHLPLAIIAGGIGGCIWAFIPGLFKVYLNVNEVIVNLMMNYIATFFIAYLCQGPLSEPGGFMPQTARVAETAMLPLIAPPARLHAGVILGLILAVIMYIILFKTTLGYEIRAIGFNLSASEYGGIKSKKIMLTVFAISGFLTGIAGAGEILGVHYRLMDGISNGYGFNAMVVAILGRLHPIGIIASSFLFSGLQVGAAQMQRVMQIPNSISDALQGFVILCLIAVDIFMEYDLVLFKNLKQISRQSS